MPPKLTLQNAIAVVFFLYLFPVLLLSVYSLAIMPPNVGWSIFAIGLFGGIVGSIAFFWLLHSWAKQDIPQPLPVNLPPLQALAVETPQEHSELLNKMNTQSEDVQRIRNENEQCQLRVQQALEELDSYRNQSNSELQKREQAIKECQNTLLEQRLLIEKQQQQIVQLESRERELSFEVRTLLQLTKG